jgi:beta-lactamase superfamily II metal-dependent hydrolase
MPKLTFYPIGNADCCLIELADGQRLLFDYADVRNPEDDDDLRIDLAAAVRDDLKAADLTKVHVLAFTHLDRDHINRASEFFYLRHAVKYQSDDRIKFDTMWVPAAVIIEEACEDEAKIIQKEARWRLKKGEGIRVFSRPDKLKGWLEDNGLTLESRAHLITDAGQLIPGYSKNSQGVEFFVHSPFASRLDNGELLDRNTDSLVVQTTFLAGGTETKLILAADAIHEVLTKMVEVTKYHGREERLEWDIFKLPHHCSYLSLSDKKGDDETVPEPEVKRLFEQGRRGGIIVSTRRGFRKFQGLT